MTSAPTCRVFLACLVVLSGFCGVSLQSAATTGEEMIRIYAAPFLSRQHPDGAYDLPSEVQARLKAEIALAHAGQVTGDDVYGISALCDLEWVIAQRMEAHGGLNWTGPENQHFFEVHQHWFLIASELILRLDSSSTAMGAHDASRPARHAAIRECQQAAWGFMIATNPAGVDLYEHNAKAHDAFFAYRSVDRQGVLQSQGPFKGSYEIGATLWSLALHCGTGGSGLGARGRIGAAAQALDRLVTQSLRPPTERGFFDATSGTWVRLLEWTDAGWKGWQPVDWKYASEMQVGALEYSLLTGRADLLSACRRHSEYVLSQMRSYGRLRGLPDPHGNAAYEYGMSLSLLALSDQAFRGLDAAFADQCARAADEMFAYVTRSFEAASTEEHAALLTGLARAMAARTR
ncbi:MAG: hypothetical protein KAY32_04630 [Candidatus Eisenbacteria sp.]|nr:hypothetical protein [Candidatus Eisenbacteria bacterium]